MSAQDTFRTFLKARCLVGWLFMLLLSAGVVLPAFAQEEPIVLGEGEYFFVTKDDASSAPAEKPPEEMSGDERNQEPVDLQADNLTHDDKNNIITASGNVQLKQAGRTLKADSIDYNLTTDVAHAVGHVVLYDYDGSIHTADEVQLNDQLKTGFVRKLKTLMTDGSRFTAESGERKDAVKTTMKDATYTPCEPCKKNPDKAPVWQLTADEVIQDQENHRIVYDDAQFEVYGVPVAYTPYFSHPDGTIKRKSGFMTPTLGFKSNLGAMVGNEYYWAIDDHKDATLGLTAMTEEAPLATAEYRQRWSNASFEARGGLTRSGRTTETADGEEEKQPDEVRGHLFAEGLWDINREWRAGTNLEMVTDDQYARQYDLETDDVLTNEVYAERFSGRNYAVGRMLTFQDIRVQEDRVDQPNVLPEIITSFKGEPGSVPLVGGRWSFDGSFLGLQRSGVNQDVNRIGTDFGWKRRLVSDTGLLTTFDTNLRTDIYNVRDREEGLLVSERSNSASKARFFPQANAQVSYPMVKPMKTVQATIEPIVSITAAPNINVDSRIPNEDSQDVQIDASNIFEPNRFPGLDRVEDQSRVTYGLRTGLYGYEGSYGDVFLGQSYRFNEDDNPFPEGSGLDRQESDIVGQVSAFVADYYSLDYRFQLASHDLTSQRHEVDLNLDFGEFSIANTYLFAKALEGTDIDVSREQIRNSVAYFFDEDWRVNGGSTHDLGEEAGLRQAYIGLDYYGQCLSWSVAGVRNNTDDSSGQSDTEILFRIGLKNLGEFEESSLKARQAARITDADKVDMDDME